MLSVLLNRRMMMSVEGSALHENIKQLEVASDTSRCINASFRDCNNASFSDLKSLRTGPTDESV